MSEKVKPALMVIMDGWGIAPAGPTNAISVANTPVFDDMWANNPHTQITAHGTAVGLPDDDQMGNSEVGHLNLGAGRVVKQDLSRINDAMADGAFEKNPAFVDAIGKIKEKGGKAHIIGLCSPGGVHSSLDHLYAMAKMLKDADVDAYVHALTDGRDTPPSSARGFMEEIEANIKGNAKVCSIVGRFWCMDRDNRWDRVQKGYDALVQGKGEFHRSADEAFAEAYQAGQTDEFIEPRIITDDNNQPLAKIEDGDGVFFFNFRADRAREITRALSEADFDGFERGVVPQLASYVCMTEYQADFDLPAAFPPVQMKNILGQVLVDNGCKQFRCAETEKYAHVTFFFNGGVETPFKDEARTLVPSPKEVATYDLKPQMSAEAVGDAVVARINEQKDDFVLVNFANPDMVGHTGILEAAIKAAEAVDIQLGRLKEAALKNGLTMLVTADHGNSEKMWDEIGDEPFTAHTLNPVPVVLAGEAVKNAKLAKGGSLQDVAPTILDMMGLDVPAEMTGKSLIKSRS